MALPNIYSNNYYAPQSYGYYNSMIEEYDSQYGASGVLMLSNEEYSPQSNTGVLLHGKVLRVIVTGNGLIINCLSTNKQPALSDDAKIPSVKDQIDGLRNKMGLNISELAHILLVKRPTIYAWLDNKEPNKSNRKRLDIIYKLCSKWGRNGLGEIRDYLYRSIGARKPLLFLLEEKQLDETLITQVLDQIEITMSRNRREYAERAALLEKHGFKPLDQEELAFRLRCMTRVAN